MHFQFAILLSFAERAKVNTRKKYVTILLSFNVTWSPLQATEYDAVLKIPSGEFQRITRDISQFSDSMVISCTKEGVQFSTAPSTTEGSAKITLKEGAVMDKKGEGGVSVCVRSEGVCEECVWGCVWGWGEGMCVWGVCVRVGWVCVRVGWVCVCVWGVCEGGWVRSEGVWVSVCVWGVWGVGEEWGCVCVCVYSISISSWSLTHIIYNISALTVCWLTLSMYRFLLSWMNQSLSHTPVTSWVSLSRPHPFPIRP